VQRLIEQPADAGDVLEGDVPLGRVLYHLSVYQQFSESDAESVPVYLEVEGRITPVHQLDLAELHAPSGLNAPFGRRPGPGSFDRGQNRYDSVHRNVGFTSLSRRADPR
jgi:hypothetical protein